MLLLIWIDLFRSFPVLVLLILIFYGLPFLGLKLPCFAACVLALTLNNSGYYGEIFRAGIELIPAGQREAARALGLHPGQTLPGDPAAGDRRCWRRSPPIRSSW